MPVAKYRLQCCESCGKDTWSRNGVCRSCSPQDFDGEPGPGWVYVGADTWEHPTQGTFYAEPDDHDPDDDTRDDLTLPDSDLEAWPQM